MTAPEPLREPSLELDVITIFPDYLAPLYQSLVGRAIERGLISARVHDLRTWTDDAHRTVDDTPYGGGPGMVMLPEPWGRALDSLVPPANIHRADVHTREDSASAAADAARPPRLVIPSPAGRPFSATVAAELARERRLIFACGRYEGIDARVADYAADRMTVDEVSLGDYVLCGGEVAVLVMVEAIARLLPGVLGNERSAAEDSFTDSTDGLLEAPAYTKPAQWRGLEVPAVLLSGNHGAIARWRSEQSRERTAIRRPDLLTGPTLS